MKSVRIVGRFDCYTGIGRHGWAFLEALSVQNENFLVQAIVTDPQNLSEVASKKPSSDIVVESPQNIKDLADFSILCDVLGQVDDSLYRLGKINAIYFAWDSTKIPESFVEIIKFNFDFCIVPSSFVKQALIDSGIELDIIVLPLVIKDKENLFNTTEDALDVDSDKIPVFGFIGSYETRKNVDLLVNSFSNSLGNSAILKLHLTYSHLENEKLLDLVRKSGNNIRISIEELDDVEYDEFLKSIDCFVSLSMGEGYSVIPREFMFSGRPVILTYSSAHKDIPFLEGIEFLESLIPYPALYNQIDGREHGVFHGPFQEDVECAINDAYSYVKNKIHYPELIKYAKSLTAKALSGRYCGIFDPKNIIQSSFASHVSPNRNLVLKSSDLLRKYNFNKQVSLEKNKHVVLANDGGFFSIFNRYVSILVHELERDPSSVIIPDWRISSLVEHLGRKNFSSFCYGTEEDGNIFLKIFAPPFNIPLDNYNDNNYLRDDAYLRTDYNEVLEPDLTYIHAYNLYKRKDFTEWRRMYNRHFVKHISLREDMKNKITHFVKNNFSGYFVIAAHIRHPSHSMEQPGGRLPTVEVFKDHIEHQIVEAQKQDKPIKLFIASDQDSVIRFFEEHFSEILVTTHVTRATLEHDRIYDRADYDSKQKEGYQIQHLVASDASKWSVKMAEEVIIDAWLLASSDVFIHITSNVATAVSYINPELKMVYCS